MRSRGAEIRNYCTTWDISSGQFQCNTKTTSLPSCQNRQEVKGMRLSCGLLLFNAGTVEQRSIGVSRECLDSRLRPAVVA
jgi:hypothetical protein